MKAQISENKQFLPDFEKLAKKFDCPDINAIVLMGSYSRGIQGVFSDIDLVRFIDEQANPKHKDGSYIIDNYLVVVSSVRPAEVKDWFSRPELAVKVISGIRNAQILIDKNNTFASIQARAKNFEWTEEMQKKANLWVSKEMVGWIEEVHKGLEGLRSNDIGRMLNSRFGCSWGLSHVMCVYKGLLLSGDNGFYEEEMDAVGIDSEWSRLRRIAFGIEDDNGRTPTLNEQVIAGLRLYILTAEIVKDVFPTEDKVLIEQTLELIKTNL